ncbi:MAG: hypothetical protein K9L74_06600 [Candidatus Izimaplasma sp.]|nr:hypothetical protein [Candidatus Izimaplasma bacterium]
MTIFKVFLIAISGLGFGFGVDKVVDTDLFDNHVNSSYSHEETVYCHQEGDFLTHIQEGLTDEEKLLVENKIDELLIFHSITREDLDNDYDLRHTFLLDLMTFLEENDINYPHDFHMDEENHNHNDDWHHGMGRMH